MLRALAISSFISGSVLGQVAYTPILWEGDPVPGWDGQTVGWRDGSDPFLDKVVMPGGDVVFQTQHAEDNSGHHLHRFDPGAGETVAHLAYGSPIEGLPGATVVSPWRSDTMSDGSVVVSVSIRYGDGSGGTALVRSRDGVAHLLAHGRTPVPGQGVPFRGFNSDLFIEADGNSAGEAVIKGRFDLGGTEHHGVYRGGEGEELRRVIDSTQGVPGHDGASWSFTTGWFAPFELGSVPITASGDVYVRSWFEGAGEKEMLLLRSRRDGSLETLVDSTAGVPTPGRGDGAPMRGIVQLAQGGGDGVLLTSSVSATGYSGSNAGGTDVLLSLPDGPLRSIWTGDSQVPGRPDLTVEARGGQEGAAINTHNQAVVSSIVHYSDDVVGRVLVTLDPDGTGALVADGRGLPEQHPDAAARSYRNVDINEHGDVAFEAFLDAQYGGNALFHWSRGSEELTRVLQAGMEINGRTVLDYTLSPSGALTAADRLLSENGVMTASVLFAGDGFSGQQWSLVHMQVPAPGTGLMALGGLGLVGVRRRR